MSGVFSESVIEQAALAWLESIEYSAVFGLYIAPDGRFSERENYGQVVLIRRLQQSLITLNPKVPTVAIEEALRKLTILDSPSLITNNHTIHKYLIEGVPVEYTREDGNISGDYIQVIDFDNPDNNDFLAVNQFTVVENHRDKLVKAHRLVLSDLDSGSAKEVADFFEGKGLEVEVQPAASDQPEDSE